MLYSRKFIRLTICGFSLHSRLRRGRAYLCGFTPWKHPTNVWTSNALVFRFITLISYIYIYIFIHNIPRRLTQLGDFHLYVWITVSSAPLEQQLDSPTEEQLDADWPSQLGVGRIFRNIFHFALFKLLATIRVCALTSHGMFSREKCATLLLWTQHEGSSTPSSSSREAKPVTHYRLWWGEVEFHDRINCSWLASGSDLEVRKSEA